MTKFKTDVVYKITKEKTGNGLEMGNLYFKNVPVTYAQVHKPANKWQSDDKAYQVNIFIDKDTMNKVEDLGVNKEFAEVGVTKKKKGANRGSFKYPLDEVNGDYEGMFGAQLTRNTVKRDKSGAISKEYSPLKVIDKDLNLFTQDVGNGSVCTIKTFCYRNAEDMLVMMMDTFQVVEHVPYEGGGSNFDEEFGGVIPEAHVAPATEEVEQKPSPATTPAVSDGFDEDLPF